MCLPVLGIRLYAATLLALWTVHASAKVCVRKRGFFSSSSSFFVGGEISYAMGMVMEVVCFMILEDH